MALKELERYFIAPGHHADAPLFYRYRLLLNASVFTSLFSLLYLIVSIVIRFEPGVYLMIFNVAGFLLLPFLMKTRMPIRTIGNLYVATGTLAVVILIGYSGGIESPVFPWLIAPPVLALLTVGKMDAIVWAAVSLACIITFIVHTIPGNPFPVRYQQDTRLFFVLLSSSGVMLIVVTISMIFERNTSKALASLTRQKKALQESQEQLAVRHQEIVEKNNTLAAQKEELLITSEQLKELNEKKDYLMEVLAHDLKSPLANIQGLIGLINTDHFQTGSVENDVVKLIVDSSRKSQILIDKILNSENLENIVYNLRLETVDVSAIVSAVVDDLREVAARKNIHVKLFIDTTRRCLATADKIYLVQVYENLLNNAIKFSLPGKQVFVSVACNGALVRTEVRDEGPSIARDEMHMLFKKFKKLSNRPTAGESSSGLGLSIVKHYTELLKGRVWCESERGQGASFIVELQCPTP